MKPIHPNIMQKLSLNQSLQQRLSPQQIQFIKLLQIPTAELDTRIEEELEINPALEEGQEDWQETSERDEYDDDYGDEGDFDDDDKFTETYKEVDIESYLHDDEIHGYKMQGDGGGQGDEDRDFPLANINTLTDLLMQQLGYLRLDEREQVIGNQLIGSVESDGYIRRPMQSIVNDLAFIQGVYTDVAEVEAVLKKVQTFDPPGIGART